jgi:hypothetical protein
MKKKSVWGALLSLVVTVAVLTVFGGIAVSADVTIVSQGNCGANGDNVTYKLYSDGLLEITGTGAMMDDTSWGGSMPWCADREGITSVTISEGVTYIGDFAFYNCRYLVTASIPSSVTNIGDYAFYQCYELTTANLSDNVTVIGERAFYWDQKLSFPNFPHYVTTIGDYAFYYCQGMKTLIIPDTVTSIGNGAFCLCDQLEIVSFPDSDNLQFTTIPNTCFSSCYALNLVAIPEGITTIGDGAFGGCTSITTLALPDSVNKLGVATFSGSGLTTFTIPDGVEEIPEQCFNSCHSLETIDIPDSVNAFGHESFRDCENLKSVVIPNGTKTISSWAFCNCLSLESVTLPDTLETIEQSAFWDCESLKQIDFPASLKTIEHMAFGLPSYSTEIVGGLESIVLPEGLTRIEGGDGYGAFQNTQITSITIPGSLEKVEENAFNANRQLQSVTFSEGVKVIEGCAFEYCTKIKTVVIPSTVTEVGFRALGQGQSMTDIYCYADPENLIFNTYSGNFNSNTKFHVPAEYLDKYLEKFPALADNLVGDASGNIAVGSSTHLCGYTLSMDGNIGVNFYMTLGDDILNNASTAYMQFTVNGKTQKVKVSDAKRDGVYYVFRCDTVAKEMTDTISAQMFISDGNADGDAYTYSVRDYAVYILNHQNDFGAKTVAVVKAMLNYGASAQKFFGYKLDNLANSVLSDNDRKIPYVDPTAMVFTSSAKVVNADIKLEKVSLSLKSEITMKLYFSGDTSGVDFYVGPTKLKVSKSGSYTVVTITGIYAQNIGTGVNVDAYAGSTYLGSARCAPMRYCQLALTSNDAAVTPELKEVVSALYYYSQALIQYAG